MKRYLDNPSQLFDRRLVEMHEARNQLIAAEARRAEARTRAGIFLANARVARAERALSRSSSRYDKVLLAAPEPEQEA